MATTSANCSKAIKNELKAKYPETKFSVTSENFAGGNSVNVEWIEGPSTDDISEITGKYKYGNFNGMIDMYEMSNCNDDLPQVKYISLTRDLTAQTQAKAVDEINQKFGLNIKYEISASSWRKGWDNFNITNDEFLPNMNTYTTQFVWRQIQEMGL